jgi:diaminopimelate decarboxylase
MSGPPGFPTAAVGEPRIEVGTTVSGLPADGLLERYGSPLYIYDAEVIRARASRLRAALPAGVEIAFATKANPSPGVLRVIASAGLGADVASAGELRAVLRAGVPPARIVFTGPGKTDAELEAALAAGVGGLTLESLDELESVIGLAGRARPGQGLLLRLATTDATEERPIIGGAGNAKFGLTDAEADEAVTRLLAAGVLADRVPESTVGRAGPGGRYVLRGFHAFGASNVRDAGLLVQGAADLARRAERIAQRHGVALELLDAGGGLGIPYADHEASLDVPAMGEGLAAELSTWAGRPVLARCRLLFEPGRWLLGPAGAYLCRVVRTKERHGRHVAVMDGGIHHLLRPRLVGQDHRIVSVGEAAVRPRDARVDVVGPLCTGLDLLAAGVSLPAPRAGDVYAVLDAGAYGYSEAMPFFLSHPIPAEVVVEGADVSVSRERVEPA